MIWRYSIKRVAQYLDSDNPNSSGSCARVVGAILACFIVAMVLTSLLIGYGAGLVCAGRAGSSAGVTLEINRLLAEYGS